MESCTSSDRRTKTEYAVTSRQSEREKLARFDANPKILSFPEQFFRRKAKRDLGKHPGLWEIGEGDFLADVPLIAIDLSFSSF